MDTFRETHNKKTIFQSLKLKELNDKTIKIPKMKYEECQDKIFI